MKTLISIKLLILTLLVFGASAQNSFKINGQIDTLFLSKYKTDQIILRLKKNASRSQTDSSILVPVNNKGQFKIELNIADSTAYIAFELQDNRQTNRKGWLYNISEPNRTNSFSEVYLFAKGDDVTMNIKFDNSIQFMGTGSEKLNCQYFLYSLLTLPMSMEYRSIQLENKGKLEESLQLEVSGIKIQALQLISLLASCKADLNDQIYQQLKLDAITALKQRFYFKTPNYYLVFPSKKDQETVQNYFRMVDTLYSEIQSKTSDRIKNQSAFYTPMLLERAVSKLIVFNENRNSYKDFSFDQFFRIIKSEYTSLIRDKLIQVAFENYAVKKTDELRRVLPDAIHTIQDKTIKVQLTQLMAKYETPAFPFVFYDVNNKPVKLQDFTGKLIVMDFWFTGCIPCTMVAKAMHPIFEKYKNRKDIVFITVSTDPKDKWLESVKSEKYSSNEMVNLHTNGKGFADPMLVYYKFTGLPKQLIISKKGQLISLSPPRPDVGKENVLEFEKLINDNL